MSMRLTVNLASPCLFSFLVTAVYFTDLPPLD